MSLCSGALLFIICTQGPTHHGPQLPTLDKPHHGKCKQVNPGPSPQPRAVQAFLCPHFWQTWPPPGATTRAVLGTLAAAEKQRSEFSFAASL